VRPDGELELETRVRAEWRDEGRGLDFSGPFIQGSPGARFLYLGWRPANGPVDRWIRRWKIALGGIGENANGDLSEDDAFEIRLPASEAKLVWPRGDGWQRCSALVANAAGASRNEEM
jgi:hypothetical protein